MSTEATPRTPREVHPVAARLMEDCLVWLADQRFIEDYGHGIHEDAVLAFNETLPGAGMQQRHGRALIAFLAWMDYGDRIHRTGPENPYGENLEFYHHDYPSARQCAEVMVGIYREGT